MIHHGHHHVGILIPQFKAFMIMLMTVAIKYLGILCIALKLEEVDSKKILFSFFIGMMFLPDIAMIVSKGFRLWIKNGIEGSDGKFESDDLAKLIVHYSTLWCIRLYVIFGLCELFFKMQVRETYVLGSLAGAFGVETIGFLFLRKKDKS